MLLIERIEAALERELLEQAQIQRGCYYTPADECGVASCEMNIVIRQLAQAVYNEVV